MPVLYLLLSKTLAWSADASVGVMDRFMEMLHSLTNEFI